MGSRRVPQLLIIALLVMFLSGFTDHAGAEESRAAGTRQVTIDFDNVDIRLFIKYISELTGKNFVIDKAVQGNVTILSPTKISDEEAYRVFESVLEVNGFTTVASGSVIKIIPAAAARSANVETLKNGSSRPEDRVVTQLVPLKYSTPDEMKKVLTPLVSRSSVIISHPQSGMLILTETQSNIQRLLEIIHTLDVEYSNEEVAVIDLHYASADSLAKIIGSIYQKSAVVNRRVTNTSAVKVVPYERANALVILAESQDMQRVRQLVSRLDRQVERGEGNIQVYYLQNATAAEMAKVLTALPSGDQPAGDNGKAPAISKEVKITADEETNSLIITASREEYDIIKNVIQKLDIPRQMVYLEALILEVNATKQFDVGVEWSWSGSVSGMSDGGAFTSFNTAASGNENGFALGVLKQGIKIGDLTFPDIKAVLRAYKGDSDINIISTPQILTTDNKKAEISVGENVPYITSQNTNASDQDYTQYEYRDVATKLTITPHINQADSMRLEIQTEIVKLKSTSEEFRPTTFRRTADTTVIVNDQDTVVLGGIIGEDTVHGETKVPLLGDIPVLGALFRSESNNNVKTNMFIFITPRIMRNPANISGVTLGKQDTITQVMPQSKAMFERPVSPEHAQILTQRGYAKLVENKNQEARQYFEEALQNDPANPYTLLNIGVVAEREGNSQQAIAYYQRVIATGTEATAVQATEPSKEGLSLVQIARENIERLQMKMKKAN
ncbi:MAG: type II secretion system secretin GspD [Desulfopila sp.]